MDCVIAPVDQRYDAPALAVKVTAPPGQKVVEPLAVIAAVGFALMLTATAAEVAEHEPLLTVTE